MSSINHSKDLEVRTVESGELGYKRDTAAKENSYFDNVKICRKNNLSQLSKLGNNFATEDLRKNMDMDILKKHTSPLDIYGDSGTFDEF